MIRLNQGTSQRRDGRVIVIDPARKVGEAVKAHLHKMHGWDDVEWINSWDTGVEAAIEKRAAAVFVNVDAGLEPALKAAARITSKIPDSALLGVSRMENGRGEEWLLQALRSGYRDFLKFPLDSGEVEGILLRVLRPGEKHGPQRGGKVVAAFSPRGGVGLTTLVVNLAVAMNAQSKKKMNVGLVDLDLEMGDVSFFLNLAPSVTIADIPENDGRPIEESCKEVLIGHPASGVQVLAAPQCIEEAETVASRGVHAAITGMRRLFDWVVINTAHTLSPVTLQALDAADVILLVTATNLAAVHSVKRTLGVFQRLGYADRAKLIVSRIRKNDDVQVEDIERSLEFPVSAAVPSEEAVGQAVNRGLSLVEFAPRSHAARAILKFAQQLAGTNGSQTGKTRGGSRRRWFFRDHPGWRAT